MATPPTFSQLLQSGSEVGLFSGILPFIIAYTIFFFLIRRIGLLDDNNDTFAAILAIAFAFYTSRFTMMYGYETFILQYMSRIALITVGVLGLLVVLAFVGMDLSNDNKMLGYVMALIVIVAFTVSGGIPVIAGEGALGQISQFINYLIETGLVWVIAVLGLLWWTLKDDDGNSEGGGLPDLFEAMGGGGPE